VSLKTDIYPINITLIPDLYIYIYIYIYYFFFKKFISIINILYKRKTIYLINIFQLKDLKAYLYNIYIYI